MPVQGKYLYREDDLTKVYEIRKKVFIEEQGISAKDEFDEIDDLAIHVLVFSTDSKDYPVATGRVYFDGTDYRIGRVAVLKAERGKKYGDFVVRMLANKAFLAGAKQIIIHSQISAIPFYEKIGFVTYGNQFTEDGIPHIAMKLVSGSLCKECNSKKMEEN